MSGISREYSIFNQLTILAAYFADTHRLILALLSYRDTHAKLQSLLYSTEWIKTSTTEMLYHVIIAFINHVLTRRCRPQTGSGLPSMHRRTNTKCRPTRVNISCQSRTRTVVRECCKGDDASQRGNGKFDPLPRPNPLTDHHQKLHTWLGPGYLPTCKI